MNNIENTWNDSPSEVREFFPKNYIERYKRCALKILTLSFSNKPEEVVGCLEEAVTALDPKYSYNPGTCFSRFTYWFICRLPKPIADVVIHDQCVLTF